MEYFVTFKQKTRVSNYKQTKHIVMRKATFIKEIIVDDVEVSMFIHENGGVFGIDSSWIIQCTDEDTYPVIPDPFDSVKDAVPLMLVGV